MAKYIKNINIYIALALLVVMPNIALASTPAVFGKTYQIAEKDALDEIKMHASKVDWQKVMQSEARKEAIRKYHPKDLVQLPRAEKDRRFWVDMSYSLEMDVPDGKGGILYPKGYTFNPLDYTTYQNIIVVLDPTDPEQLEWFEKSEWATDYRVRLLISDGSYIEVSKKLRRPIYYVKKKIVDRFQLEYVPAIVSQNGRFMEVVEKDVSKKEK